VLHRRYPASRVPANPSVPEVHQIITGHRRWLANHSGMTVQRLRTLDEIDRLIDEGTAVESIATLIDQLPVDPQEKIALWLRAWSRDRQRRSAPERPPGVYLG
jgi:hypothetical protein